MNLEMLKDALLNPENLAKAYMMTKNLLREMYGEEFASLDEKQQALAVGHALADLLHI